MEVPACGGFPDWVFSGKHANKGKGKGKGKVTAKSELGEGGLRNKKIWNTHLGDGEAVIVEQHDDPLKPGSPYLN